MAGFMAGFGTKLSELIEEDRKYYRDAAAKRRDYIQTYGTRAVTDRENKANAANWYAQALGELDILEAKLSIDNMKSVKNKLQDIATEIQVGGA